MTCLKKMIRIFYFLLPLYFQYLICEADPLIGKNVQQADETIDKKLTFLVSISRNNSMNTMKEKHTHVCGGSLVTRQHVLTAAHCFANRKDYHEIVVKVGSFDLKKTTIHEVKWASTYEEWLQNNISDEHRGANIHDIAIVKLVKSVSCSVQLPRITNIPDTQLYLRHAKLAGWGLNNRNGRPRFLKVADVIVPNVNECLFITLEPIPALAEFLRKIYLCSKADPPILLGCGDSGGPLLINGNEIIGVNVGDCRDNRTDPKDLSVYQNKHLTINYHRRFIDELTKL